ncbi:hypothetical protein FA95DRAFT_1560111 [Auriscalpium vulgare]|uniref:Uncharacterized protein n=1 Tax=Auriscalpium vulgare TaxID=40419 RepID=A0ACB8RRM8_9AGAM|nr:hypothetical protein FA95DRAFT_1560111 [Auriscalpium vulgare]
MVLKILAVVGETILPSKYDAHAVLAILTLVTIYTYAQGRKTTRERDLHGRTVLITGAFTPHGLSLMDSLARRGAHIIALSPDPIDTGSPSILIPLLRSETSNENIYAEHCDLSSPSSIRAFCTGLLKAEQQRLDAVIFAHEYAPVGTFFGSAARHAEDERAREAASCATFLLTTLLLPALLVAPVERDIRLVALINPFYAAAAPNFSPAQPLNTSTPPPVLAAEGRRALRTAILMRHLQRVLDALPTGAQVPRTDVNAHSIPVVSDKVQRSNIVAVSVSPGISRTDVIAPLLGAGRSGGKVSWGGLLFYILLNPLLRLITKSPTSALQSVLHALFLPTPFKLLAAIAPDGTPQERSEEEVLKPGALYAECAVVRVNVPPAPVPPENDIDPEPSAKGKEKAKAEDAPPGQTSRPDDGELGGEVLGTLIWDEYESELKVWEDRAAAEEREQREREELLARQRDGERHTPPTVDTSTSGQ